MRTTVALLVLILLAGCKKEAPSNNSQEQVTSQRQPTKTQAPTEATPQPTEQAKQAPTPTTPSTKAVASEPERTGSVSETPKSTPAPAPARSGLLNSQRFVGTLRGQLKGQVRFRRIGDKLTQAFVSLDDRSIVLRKTTVDEDRKFSFRGTAGHEHIRLDGQFRRGGRWVRGEYRGMVQKKKIQGTFSAVSR